MSNLQLVWWRQNPKKTEEDIERIVAPFLTKAQVKRGFEPWQEKLHRNLFYQRVVTDKDLKPTELGVTIKPLRLAAILKSAPMLPQSDTLGFQMAVDETSSKSSKGKSAKQKKKSSGKGTGDRLIELGPKKSKSAYIRRRVKLVAGKSVADALAVQVPDKDDAERKGMRPDCDCGPSKELLIRLHDAIAQLPAL